MLKRSVQILHSCWLFLFFLLFLEPQIFFSMLLFLFKNGWWHGFIFPVLLILRIYYFALPPAFHDQYWQVFFLPILMAARIYFGAGIYGMLVELASGEEIIVRFSKFKENARKYWKVYALISLLPVFIHFVLYAIGPSGPITLDAVLVYGDVVFSMIFVSLLVRIKYRPSIFCQKKILSFGKEWLVIAFFAVVNIAAFHVFSWMSSDGENWGFIPNALREYLHFLNFLLLAHLVLGRYPENVRKFEPAKELYLISPIGGAVLWGLITPLLREYPPWFLVLRALTPSDYHVREFNRAIWRHRYAVGGKLVAISCYSSNSAEAYRIAKEFRQKGSTVIMGGPHVSIFPDEALEFCDAVVIGEAEGVWEQVVKDYESGILQPKYYAKEDATAFARVHQYQLGQDPEIIKDFMETTRGCKYQCEFCAIPSLRQGCFRKKAVSEVLDLVRVLRKKIKYFAFIDNNFYSDPGYTRELLEGLTALKVRWVASTSLDIANHEQILRLVRQSGCWMFLIGYEISSNSQESSRGGKFGMAQHYLRLTRKIQKMGIGIKAQMIMGFDTDHPRTFWDMWWFCFRLRPFLTVAGVLTPLPGSRFYQQVLSQDRIRTLNWRNYHCQTLVFQPKHIPVFMLRQPFYSVYLFILLTTTSFGGWLILFLIAFVFLTS